MMDIIKVGTICIYKEASSTTEYVVRVTGIKEDNVNVNVTFVDDHYPSTKVVPYSELTALDPEDAVCEDYFTGEPIFEQSEPETIYGFDRYGEVIELGKTTYYNLIRNDVATCDECRRHFYRDSDYFENYWINGNIGLCNQCYEDSYCTCADCGNIIHNDNAYFDDGEGPYCEYCFYENGHSADENQMHNYSYKPYPVFHKHDGFNYQPGVAYMGVELEVDKGHSVPDCVSDLSDIDTCEDLFYCKHDGSLNDGIEIVSHPCDLEFHLKEFPWDNIVNVVSSYGFKSHDAGTCGLHVHVSRNAFGSNQDVQDLNIAKCMVLFDKYWDELVNFSRRNYNQLNRWAKKPDAKIYSYDNEMTAVNKAKNSGGHDRYKAINLTNEATVEFRLFRGSLKVQTIKATLEFLSNLLGYVKNASLADVQDAKWTDITRFAEYPELVAYLEERNLTEVPDKPKPVEPKPVVVRFNKGDIVWFATSNTDDQPARGVVNAVDSDPEGITQPLYIVENTNNGFTNFLIDEEIFDNDRIAQLEAGYHSVVAS